MHGNRGLIHLVTRFIFNLKMPSPDSFHLFLRRPSDFWTRIAMNLVFIHNMKKYRTFTARIWQVHGPITKEFAVNKLAKLKFKKGSYLVRQSAETQGKVYPCFYVVRFLKNA